MPKKFRVELEKYLRQIKLIFVMAHLLIFTKKRNFFSSFFFFFKLFFNFVDKNIILSKI